MEGKLIHCLIAVFFFFGGGEYASSDFNTVNNSTVVPPIPTLHFQTPNRAWLVGVWYVNVVVL